MRGSFAATLVASAVSLAAQPAPAQTGPVFLNPLSDLTVMDEPGAGAFQSRLFRLSGYYRFRSDVAHDLDLDRGPLPGGEPLWPQGLQGSDPETIGGANMRLRLRPELQLGGEVRLAARIDCLDNVVMGSTPRGFPRSVQAPEASGSSSQEPPVSGVNSYNDSVRVKQVWGEFALPFGLLQVGRTGNHWGMGMMANSGEGLDDDVDDSVDRIGFVTSVFDHFVAVAWDFNASGPTTATPANPAGQPHDLTDRDDVRTLSFAILRYLPQPLLRSKLRAGKAVLNYGAYVTWRTQSEEAPSYYMLGLTGEERTLKDSEFVRRDVDMLGGDAWARLNVSRLRIEVEGAYVRGDAANTSMVPGVDVPALTFDQWGGVGQAEWQPAAGLPLSLLAESGVASGDPAWGFGAYPPLDQSKGHAGDLDAPQIRLPGDTSVDNFRFHPNYHIDKILWRRIVGTFTDGVYAKGRLRYQPIQSLRLDLACVYSRTLNEESAPGIAKPLGVESFADITWFAASGFQATATYAVLFPLPGFRNVFTGADPSPAQLAEGNIAFIF